MNTYYPMIADNLALIIVLVAVYVTYRIIRKVAHRMIALAVTAVAVPMGFAILSDVLTALQ